MVIHFEMLILFDVDKQPTIRGYIVIQAKVNFKDKDYIVPIDWADCPGVDTFQIEQDNLDIPSEVIDKLNHYFYDTNNPAWAFVNNFAEKKFAYKWSAILD